MSPSRRGSLGESDADAADETHPLLAPAPPAPLARTGACDVADGTEDAPPGPREAAEAALARNEVAGLAFMALSALGFSLMSVFVKIAGTTFPSTEVVFVRSVIQMICGIAGCWLVGVAPWGPPTVNRWLLVARGTAGALGLGFYFFTIINMPLGDGTTLFFIGPAITAVMAYLFLGETFTPLDGFALVSCLVGVVLVSRPEFIFGGHVEAVVRLGYTYPRYIPAGSAILAAMILSVAYCLVRVIGKSVHFMVHVTYFGCLSTVVSGVLLWSLEKPIGPEMWSAHDWAVMLGVGIMAFAAQCFLNAPATLMRNLDIVFAYIFGLWLFHEVPTVMSIAGALLIGLTTAGVAFVKRNDKAGFGRTLETFDELSASLPSAGDCLKLLVVARVLAGVYSNIQDCDEVFNFWEPVHYLHFGTGLQTWEYAPQYSIRSWAYIALHSVVTIMIEFGLTPNKVHIFYLTRLVLGLASAFAESTLVKAVAEHVHPRAASYLLVLLLFSPGMFIAPASLLPSTFCMYLGTWMLSIQLAPPTRRSTWLYVALCAASVCWGWPFSGALAIPFIIERLLSRQWLRNLWWMVEGSVIALLAVVAPLVAIDGMFYKRWTLAALNIVLYNVFGGGERGPDIYGTEPWHFYLLNGLVNFNVAYLAAMASMPALAAACYVAPGLVAGRGARAAPAALRTAMCISGMYLWLGIFVLQPHKEERFMYVVFPGICFSASVGLFYGRGVAETALLHLRAPQASLREERSAANTGD
nr:mannosyltransferase [Polyrhizophydium stewartii]